MRELAHLSVPAFAVLEKDACWRLSIAPRTESCLSGERSSRASTVDGPSSLGDPSERHSLDVMSLLALVEPRLLREWHLVDGETVHPGSTGVEDGSLLRRRRGLSGYSVGLDRSVQRDGSGSSRRNRYRSSSVNIHRLPVLSRRHRRCEGRCLRIEGNKRRWWWHPIVHGHPRESARDELGRLVRR